MIATICNVSGVFDFMEIAAFQLSLANAWTIRRYGTGSIAAFRTAGIPATSPLPGVPVKVLSPPISAVRTVQSPEVEGT
jgi:hypothetical protein